MTQPLIELQKASIKINDRIILNAIDFSITDNEIVTIVGPNGSGKSTLLRALIGAVPLSSGHMIRRPMLSVGYVPQSLNLDPTLPMTVARFLSLPKRQSKRALDEALGIAGVQNTQNQQITSLSGGQLQRVLLARALINQPQLLILDEATRGLDQPGSADFYAQIESVNQTLGCAVLMVSHELHVVMSASDRVVCLNGHVCCEGKPAQVASDPEYKALFGTGTHGALALYRHEHDHQHTEHCQHD